MQLRRGSLPFVLFYSILGGVLGFGTTWLAQNTSSWMEHLLAKLALSLQVALAWF